MLLKTKLVEFVSIVPPLFDPAKLTKQTFDCPATYLIKVDPLRPDATILTTNHRYPLAPVEVNVPFDVIVTKAAENIPGVNAHILPPVR
jgi:hypothetical protein